MKFKTLGCRLNTFETETIKSIAEKNNFKDLILVNTCSVTQEASRNSKKYVRQLKRKDPNKKMVVTGCDVQIDPEKYENMNEVDIILGNSEKLSEATWKKISNSKEKRQKFHKEHKDIGLLVSKNVPNFTNRSRAYLEIQNGCDHSCTFCIIPQGRGKSRSTPPHQILEKVKRFIALGFKEIVLTGVDITSWGKDIGERKNLGELVELILMENPTLSRLRLSSLDISEIDEKLIRLFKKEHRLMPHLHLSLQSGNNMILKRMKRRHSREATVELCKELKEARPELTFGADLIVGFPTENDQSHQNSIKLIKEADIKYGHIFPFSPRKETPAYRMKMLPKEVINYRAKELRDIIKTKTEFFLKSIVGTKQKVLIEKNNSGYTPQFTRVKFQEDVKSGNIIETNIVKAQSTFVDGKVE